MNFKIEPKNAKILQAIVDATSSLIKEGKFVFTKNLLEFNAIDPTKAAMVNISIPHGNESFFEQYKVDTDHTVCLDITEFATLLKRSSSSDALEFQFDSERNKIKLIFNDTSKKSRSRSFELSTIDDNDLDGSLSKKIDASKMVATLTMKMKTDLFMTAIKDARTIDAEALEITGNDNGLKITALKEMMNDQYQLDIQWKDEEEASDSDKTVLSSTIDGETKSKYALSYLEKMFKIGTTLNIVNIKLATDQPIVLSFKTNDEKASMTLILAPQGDDDEDFDGSDDADDSDDEFNDV